MGVTLQQGEAIHLLRLEGAVGVSCAAEFKELLAQAFGSGCEVRISLAGTTDLDVTAVQLIWAAARKARVAGVNYSIVDAPPDALLSVLTEAGLQPFITPGNLR